MSRSECFYELRAKLECDLNASIMFNAITIIIKHINCFCVPSYSFFTRDSIKSNQIKSNLLKAEGPDGH